MSKLLIFFLLKCKGTFNLNNKMTCINPCNRHSMYLGGKNYECVPFYPRLDDTRRIEYRVVRKLVELPQGGSQCTDYLYFRVDGTNFDVFYCNNRDPESWNYNVLEFRAQNFIEIIYQVRRAKGVGGKFWMQIRGIFS